MRETFFENPLWAYVVLGLAAVVLLAVFLERRTPRRAALLLVPVVLAGLTFLVERVVLTDREKIVRAAEDIAHAVETGRTEEIPRYLDGKFVARLRGLPVIKPAVVAVCRSETSAWGIVGVSLHNVQVQVTGMQAKMHVNSIISFGEGGRQRTGIIWDVLWIKRGQEWLVLEVSDPRPGLEL